jgi:prevent-host-death family protein
MSHHDYFTSRTHEEDRRTQAKAKLSELLARVAYADERYVIERRGKPLAAIVSIEDFERLDGKPSETGEEPRGALALVGLWADIMTDEEIDEMVAHIYAEREKDVGPPPPTFD